MAHMLPNETKRFWFFFLMARVQKKNGAGCCMATNKHAASMIFRHADGLSPHATKEECEIYVARGGKGCAKPFQFDGQTVTKCPYL
jgi:hypothetical protein